MTITKGAPSPSMYSVVSASLHWISAGGVLALVPLEMIMNVASGSVQVGLYRAHLVIGWLVVGLTLARVAWRFVEPPPPPPPMPAARRAAFHSVHTLLPALMSAHAITGAASAYASGMGLTPRAVDGPVEEGSSAHGAHWVLAAVLGCLLAAHVIGALSYRPGGLPCAG